jgi:hypothetical protein
MKPINYSGEGCDPISSNCVIWNGPDIDCIELCKGDNVSTVVFKLATELCTLLETFKITNFDLSCFDLQKCAPDDFIGLIQLLIDKICENEGITPGTPSTGGCPDCEVPICTDILFNPTTPGGDLITSMQLKDYVLAIGQRVCTLIDQIGTINAILNDYNVRISALENAATPTFELPEITPVCVLPAVPTSLDVVLSALEAEFCTLKQATGDNTAILTALQAACAGINNAPQLNGTGAMSDISGWFTAPANLSQSFSNLWKVVCDMRNAVSLIQNNCCDTGCNGIDLDVTVVVIDPLTIRILFGGTIPNQFIDDNPASTITITDSAGGGPQSVTTPIKSNYYDTNQYYEITLTGPNATNDIYVSTTYRFIDPVTSEQCSNTIQSIALGVNTCPDLILTADYTGVNYAFTWNGTVPSLVNLTLYNGTGTSIISTQSLNILDTSPSGTFGGLVEGTDYQIALTINGQECPAELFTTLSYACVPPGLQAPAINYGTPEGIQTGTTIEQWIIDYNANNP